MGDLRQGLSDALKSDSVIDSITNNDVNANPDKGNEPQDIPQPTPDKPQAEAPVKTDGQAPAPADVLDWTKDERHEKMWKKDPNGLYKSYKELEKVFTPLKQESERMRQMFEELQVQPDKLSEIIKGYNEFQNPENPLTKRANYFGAWLENPMYQTQVVNFFKELESSELRRLYPNMSQESIEKIQTMETELKTLKQDREQQVFTKQVEENSNWINKSLEKAKKYAESKGFTFTDEIKNKLLEHGDKNNIPPQYLFQEFLNMFEKDIEKSHSTKLEQDILKRLNKTKDSEIIPAQSGGTPPSGQSLRQRLSNVVRGQGFTK